MAKIPTSKKVKSKSDQPTDSSTQVSTKKNKSGKLSKKEYEALLEPMLIELNNMAHWLSHEKKRIVVLLEGRDTAGKGGTIGALADHLNPRRCQVVALTKPSEEEKGQWYFQRYVPHLPTAGHITLFDRSWYNRSGVETVMGFCTPEETEHFFQQAPIFEKLLVDDGILLFKYWLSVDQDKQEERFADRLNDPLKRWKLSPIDLQARDQYEAYGRARDVMLARTHTEHAPWTVVDFNDQRLGRLTLLRHLLDQLPDTYIPPEEIDFPPLRGAPAKENFKGPLKPIPPFKVSKEAA